MSETSTTSPTLSRPDSRRGNVASFVEGSVPVEELVEHLLAARRSLSKMGLVLEANSLTTTARLAHEESVILEAQTDFLRRGIDDEVRVLLRVRKGMMRAYDAGKREFKQILRTLDAANGRLEQTMEMLRQTMVESAFRPPDEKPRSLLHFVDEKNIDGMRELLKESIAGLQGAQTSFDGDLLRFDNDLRNLKSLLPSPSPASPADSIASKPMEELLSSLTEHSHAMAELLTSLTRHFDLCVTAVRTTEGGAALARRKAAEVTQSQLEVGESVSISGVIAEQESQVPDLEPITPEERAEMLHVVVQDASEVDGVVKDLEDRLAVMQLLHAVVMEHVEQSKARQLSTAQAFRVLEEIGTRLQSYVAAETEFTDRWEEEKSAIFAKMDEMDGLRVFYEGYASAYDNLILEVDRRRAAEDKIKAVWRRAKENVDKIVEVDAKERQLFRQEVGEYLPTDLWTGMSGVIKTWNVVPIAENHASSTLTMAVSTPQLGKAAVDRARERLEAARQSLQ